MLAVGATYGQVTQPLHRHFFRMARPGYHTQVLRGYFVADMQVLGNHHVLVGHHALDGGDDNLAADGSAQFFQVRLQKRTGNSQNQYVRSGHHLVDVGGKMYVADIKRQSTQVVGVLARFDETVDLALLAHVPMDLTHIAEHDFSQRSGPTASAQDSYLLAG